MTDIVDLTKILVRPLVTEKSARLQEDGTYTFEVPLTASKGIVKQAVERLFKVDVVRVNTSRVKGKRKRFGMRMTQRKDWKKAIVILKSGQRIPIVEGN